MIFDPLISLDFPLDFPLDFLGRQAAVEGIKFWTDLIINKGLSLGGMALAIMTSKEQLEKIGFDITQADATTQVNQFYKSFWAESR